MRKHKHIVFFVLLLVLGFAAGIVTVDYYQNAHITVKTIAENKKSNEKYEPINDVSFIKEQDLSAWIPWWDEERVMTSLQASGNSLHSISPIWYTLTDEGNLVENPAKKKDEIKLLATSSRISIIPSINNEDADGFDEKRVEKFLNDKVEQETFIQSLIGIAESEGYSGWDIDWEQKNIQDKDKFTAFIKRAAEELHKKQLTLIVTVQAKSEDTIDTTNDTADDWKELAKYADQIRIMAYDFHYDGSDPGPVTPLDDLESVLDYAVKVIPRDKIALGVPMYGYDWQNKNGESVQYADAMSRIKQFSGTFVRDPETEELVGRYSANGVRHNLWFTDTKSVIRILYIASNYDIKHIIFWRLGGEEQGIWKIK